MSESRLLEITDHLRQAARHLGVAVSKAGEYRGNVHAELAARETHRRGVKVLIRLGAMADRIETIALRRYGQRREGGG